MMNAERLLRLLGNIHRIAEGYRKKVEEERVVLTAREAIGYMRAAKILDSILTHFIKNADKNLLNPRGGLCR